jgi:hypothetical protein
MQIYEIRVLEDDGKTSLIASEVLISDNAAIRSGQGMAAGRKFEVWRGMDCIYGIDPAPPANPNTVRLDLSPP